MRHFYRLTLSLAVLAAYIAAPMSASANHAKGAHVDLTVLGMVCEFCAESILKIFNEEESVQNLTIDFDSHLVSIDLKDGQSLSDERIKELIHYSGYDLEKIVRH